MTQLGPDHSLEIRRQSPDQAPFHEVRQAAPVSLGSLFEGIFNDWVDPAAKQGGLFGGHGSGSV